MNHTHTNGRVQRKTLASQLDRLDNTIDALADGLNKAVADAVREAVTGAIEAVVHQMLSNPELLRQLAGHLTPAPPVAVVSQPSPARPGRLVRALRWLGCRLSNRWAWVRERTEKIPASFRARTENIRGRWRETCQKVREAGQTVWRLRRPVLISLLIGVLVGAFGYLLGPVLSSVALGLCGMTMSFLGFLAAPFVRLWRSLTAQQAT